jgi:DNA-binding transcriptional LysR family regulator
VSPVVVPASKEKTVELRQLELFVGVADELHFGRAAERLFIAQSALSQHIRRLEREVGVELFDRGKRHVRLTPAGAAFNVEARRVLDRAELAPRVARAAARGQAGVLELSYASTAPPRVLARLVTASRSGPFGEVRLNERTAPRIEADLNDDLIDIAVIDGSLDRSGLEELTVDDEPFVAVVHPGADLAATPVLTLDDLADQPFVVPRATWAPRLAVTIGAACQRAGFRPAVVAEADSATGWMVPILAGEAVTLAPASIAARWNGDVQLVPLAGVTPRAVTSLMWRTGAPPHVHAFAEGVRQALDGTDRARHLHTLSADSEDGAAPAAAGPRAA